MALTNKVLCAKNSTTLVQRKNKLKKSGIFVLSFFITACGGSSSSGDDTKEQALLTYSGSLQMADFSRLSAKQHDELVEAATTATNKAIRFSRKSNEEIYAISYLRSAVDAAHNAQSTEQAIEPCTSETHDTIRFETYDSTNLEKTTFASSCFSYEYMDSEQTSYTANDVSSAATSLAQLFTLGSMPKKTEKTEKTAEMIIEGAVITHKLGDEFSIINASINSPELAINTKISGTSYLTNEYNDHVSELGQVFKCKESNCYIQNLSFTLSYSDSDFSQARTIVTANENHTGFNILAIPANTSCAANCEGINNMIHNPYAGLDLRNDGIRVYHHDHGGFDIAANDLVPCDHKIDTAFQSGKMKLKDKVGNELSVTFHSCTDKPVSEFSQKGF